MPLCYRNVLILICPGERFTGCSPSRSLLVNLSDEVATSHMEALGNAEACGSLVRFLRGPDHREAHPLL